MELIISITKNINHAPTIYQLLLDAFEPYRSQYTEGAFNATVVNPERMAKRIEGNAFDVFIAIENNAIAGTFSLKKINENTLYMATMAVSPVYYGKGIGFKILEEVEKIALQKGSTKIQLDTSEPLLNAIKLYEKFGFSRTGNKMDYHGLTIFEMVKSLRETPAC